MNFDYSSIRTWLINKFYVITGSTAKLFRVSEYAGLLSITAYMHELYVVYVERLFKELSWANAEKRSSLMRQAFPRYQYKPYRKKGAKDFITISADPTFITTSPVTYSGGNVSLPKWTVITDLNSTVSYYLTEDGQYLSGTVAVTKSINASQVATNLGSGLVGIPCTSHGFASGTLISITGTSNYDGYWIVDPSTTTHVIAIVSIYYSETFTSNAKVASGLVDIAICEGTPKTYFYTANGTANESFRILGSDIDNDEIEVLIVDANRNTLNTVTIIDTLYFENDIITYKCEVNDSPNFDYIEIVFGDGIKSRKLNTGEYVLVKFATTKGASNSIDTTNVLTKFSVPVRDINNVLANIYCTNRSTISGGTDYEDIESIRQNAPRDYNINDNATTSDRWETILDAHNLVLKSKVWSDYDVGVYNTNNNIVHIAAISNVGSILTNEQQTTVGAYLKQKKSVTEIIQFEGLQIIHSRFFITGGVANVSIATIESEISAILLAKYSILYNNFNENIYSLQSASLINSTVVPNLLYYTFEIKHVEKSEVYPTLTAAIVARKIIVSNNTVDGETDAEKQVFLTPFSPEVWFKRKVAGVVQAEVRAAYINPSNSAQFLGDNGYTVAGSGIPDYTTNILDVTITNPPAGVLNPNDAQVDGYWIRLVYKTQNGNGIFTNDIRLPKKYQITDCVADDLKFTLHVE